MRDPNPLATLPSASSRLQNDAKRVAPTLDALERSLQVSGFSYSAKQRGFVS